MERVQSHFQYNIDFLAIVFNMSSSMTFTPNGKRQKLTLFLLNFPLILKSILQKNRENNLFTVNANILVKCTNDQKHRHARHARVIFLLGGGGGDIVVLMEYYVS